MSHDKPPNLFILIKTIQNHSNISEHIQQIFKTAKTTKTNQNLSFKPIKIYRNISKPIQTLQLITNKPIFAIKIHQVPPLLQRFANLYEIIQTISKTQNHQNRTRT